MASQAQQSAFIAQMAPWAQAASSATGWNASLILAQWANETAWGTAYSEPNNPGNIGVYSGGPHYSWSTMADGVAAYINYINTSPYLAHVAAAGKDNYASQAYQLGISGWASGQYNNGGGPGSSLLGEQNLMPSGVNAASLAGANLSAAPAGAQTGGGMTAAEYAALAPLASDPVATAYLEALNANAQANAAIPGGTATATPDPTSATGGNATAIINAAIAQLGTAGMSAADVAALQKWSAGELTKLAAQGMDTSTIGSQIAVDIQDTPQFADAFPGIIALRNAGQPAPSVSDYQTYTTTARQLAAAAGLPSTFMSTQEIGTLVAGNVSSAELSQRIKNGLEVAAQSGPQTISELETYFPQYFSGLGNAANAYNTSGQLNSSSLGTLAGVYLNPNLAVDTLTNQLATAQIGAEGMETGFGSITLQQAQALQHAGITDTTARDTFKSLNKLTPLEGQLPGVPGSNLSQQDLINYGFFGQNQQEMANVQGVRGAPFKGGGGYATTARGTVGAGYASTQGVQGT